MSATAYSSPAVGKNAQNMYSMASFDGEGLPVDKRASSYRIMVLLGCGLLLPWNAVLTAFAYFQDLYNNPPFEFGVPLSNQVPTFFFFLWMIKYGSNWSFTHRIVGMFIVYDILLVMLPPVGMLVNAGAKDIGLGITYVIFAGFGAACAVLQSSLFGFAGLLPPEYTQAIMAGQGISGVFMNFLMMGCQLATEHMESSDAANIEAWLFFGLAAVIVFCCIFGYMRMIRKRFVRYHVDDVNDAPGSPLTLAQEEAWAAAQCNQLNLPPSPTSSPQPLHTTGEDRAAAATPSRASRQMPRARSMERVGPADDPPDHRKYFSASHDERSASFTPGTRDSSATESGTSPNNYSFLDFWADQGLQRQPNSSMPSTSHPHAATVSDDWTTKLLDGQEHSAAGPEDGSRSNGGHAVGADLEMPEVSIMKVLGKIWYYGVVVFGVFAVSLFIFPGFLTVTCGKGPFSKMGDSWYRLILVTMFNCADLGGRVIAPPLIAFIPHNSLWGAGIIRIGLVPLFYCFVYDTLEWWWGPLFFTLILGVSNGFFGSICMMHGPSQVEAHEREMAGTLMAFCLMMGIIIGAALQLGVAQIFAADNVGKCL